MTQLPAWRVDPAWPAAPALDDDDDDLVDVAPAPDLFEAQRLELQRTVAELHLERTRQAIRLRAALRQLEQLRPGRRPPARPPGRPTEHARNDRLLALFEQTATQLPRLHRCRLAAMRLAEQQKADGAERVRVLPATTARDAIAEAERRRAGRPAT